MNRLAEVELNPLLRDDDSQTARVQPLPELFHPYAKPSQSTPLSDAQPSQYPRYILIQALTLRYTRLGLAFLCDALLFLLKTTRPTFRKLCALIVIETVVILIVIQCSVFARGATSKPSEVVQNVEPTGGLYTCGLDCRARVGAVGDATGLDVHSPVEM